MKMPLQDVRLLSIISWCSLDCEGQDLSLTIDFFENKSCVEPF